MIKKYWISVVGRESPRRKGNLPLHQVLKKLRSEDDGTSEAQMHLVHLWPLHKQIWELEDFIGSILLNLPTEGVALGINLIGHGAPGRLDLTPDVQLRTHHVHKLLSFAHYLADEAEIRILGCNVAEQNRTHRADHGPALQITTSLVTGAKVSAPKVAIYSDDFDTSGFIPKGLLWTANGTKISEGSMEERKPPAEDKKARLPEELFSLSYEVVPFEEEPIGKILGEELKEIYSEGEIFSGDSTLTAPIAILRSLENRDLTIEVVLAGQGLRYDDPQTGKTKIILSRKNVPNSILERDLLDL